MCRTTPMRRINKSPAHTNAYYTLRSLSVSHVRIKSRVWQSCVTHRDDSHHTHRVRCPVLRAAHSSCHTPQRVTARIGRSHGTHRIASWHTLHRVISMWHRERLLNATFVACVPHIASTHGTHDKCRVVMRHKCHIEKSFSMSPWDQSLWVTLIDIQHTDCMMYVNIQKDFSMQHLWHVWHTALHVADASLSDTLTYPLCQTHW